MSGTPPLVPEPDSPGAERKMNRGRGKQIKKEKDWNLKREGRKAKKGKKKTTEKRRRKSRG